MRPPVPLVLLLVSLMAPALDGAELLQQRAALVVRRERSTSHDQVTAFDAVSRTPRAIYRSSGRIPDDVEVSPEGSYVSFIEAFTTSPGVVRTRLVVIDRDGKVMRAIEDAPVGTYAWCCRPGWVAMISGPRTEDGDIGFTPESLRLIDITTGVVQVIGGIEGLPYQLHWYGADSVLYIKTLQTATGSKVYRYDARTGRVDLTSRKGVFFSPDGRYYYDWFTPGLGFHLYRAADDVEVTGELVTQVERYTRWMPGAGHVLLVFEKPAPRPTDAKPGAVIVVGPGGQVLPDRWNLAVDAETKRVTERFQGDIRAWRTSGPVLPVETRTGVELVAPRHK